MSPKVDPQSLKVDPKLPRLKRDYIGRRVRTKRVLRNGNVVISPGTIATVTQYYRGFRLETEPCEHCGVGVNITQVPEHDVDLLLDES